MKIIKNGDNLEIGITVPLTITGGGSYDGPDWSAPGVVVYINENLEEYALYHTQFLDYKDSLQATSPIAHFDSKEEALKAAEEFGLNVQTAIE